MANPSTFLSMTNATVISMSDSLDRAQALLDENSFAEAEGQLKLYEVLKTSAERTLDKYFRLVAADEEPVVPVSINEETDVVVEEEEAVAMG